MSDVLTNTEAAPEETALMADSDAPVKYPRGRAIEVAREILAVLAPVCVRVLVAGSLRRRKALVGDVEILYVPQMADGPRVDMFAPPVPRGLDEGLLEVLLERGVLTKRLSVKGSAAWGAKNKLAVHVESGIPVDLFAATAENWWNYIVCRTGGARSNIAICTAARERGWKWNPYGAGFSRRLMNGNLEVHAVKSEAEVFEFVGLPYLPPEERA